MADIPIEGLVILGLTIVVFIAMAIFVTIISLRYDWPKGYVRTTASMRGCKVTILTPSSFDELSRKSLATRCVVAVLALKDQWVWLPGVAKNPKKLDKILSHTVCWFKTEEDFEKVVKTWSVRFAPGSPAAHTTTIMRGGFGSKSLSACATRISYAREVYEQGTPWRHELTHHLMHDLMGTWDAKHQSKEIWHNYALRFAKRYKQMISDDA